MTFFLVYSIASFPISSTMPPPPLPSSSIVAYSSSSIPFSSSSTFLTSILILYVLYNSFSSDLTRPLVLLNSWDLKPTIEFC